MEMNVHIPIHIAIRVYYEYICFSLSLCQVWPPTVAAQRRNDYWSYYYRSGLSF